MQFLYSLGQEKIKTALNLAFKKGQVPHAQCFIDQGGRGGLALALECALSLLWDEIPDSHEKAVQHPDLQWFYPVTTSESIKTKPLCKDYREEWVNFLEEDLYQPLSRWLAKIGSENKQGNIGGPLYNLYSRNGFKLDTSMNEGTKGQPYAVVNGVSDYVDKNGKVQPDNENVVIFMKR